MKDNEELKVALREEEDKSKHLLEELVDLCQQMASLQETSTTNRVLKEELDQMKVQCQNLSPNLTLRSLRPDNKQRP